MAPPAPSIVADNEHTGERETDQHMSTSPVDRRAARAIRRDELGDFLRTRRAAIAPTDVGLAARGRRKTAGLRREEVAQLAGVGLSWYTWLEQARDITPSAQVLESIGRALLLDQTQTDHLFHLAGFDIPDSPTSIRPPDEPDFHEVVRALLPHAAYVLNPRFDVVAFNANAELILGGLAQREPGKRNLLRWLFAVSEPTRGLDEPSAQVAYANLSDFRVEYARHAGDPWYEELVAELQQNTDFRTWWDEHEVQVIPPTHRLIPHKDHGALQVLFMETRLVHRPEHRLRILTAADEATSSIFAENLRARG